MADIKKGRREAAGQKNAEFFGLDDWQQQSAEEIVKSLTELERKCFTEGNFSEEADGRNLAFILLPLLDSENWEIRAKALITIGRIGSAAISDEIISRLRRAAEPWWQLQFLDCWWQLPLDDAKRAEVLKVLTDWAEQPVTVRGLVWMLKELGTAAAVEIFMDFALSKKTMMVKDEFMTDAWFALTEKNPQAVIDNLIAVKPKFKIWLNFRYREEKESHYSLYPSPDYLWQCAAEFGVNRKNFKKLYFKPRKKS
ncbi:MAG: hypothetical protein ACOX7J_00540 [Bacillota bacterium]|jgi:hypothetical protein